MTKKDFVAIAKIVSGYKRAANDGSNITPEGLRTAIAHDLAGYFSSRNDQFNRSRFVDACDIGERC
jgi:hypothetical protein